MLALSGSFFADGEFWSTGENEKALKITSSRLQQQKEETLTLQPVRDSFYTHTSLKQTAREGTA